MEILPPYVVSVPDPGKQERKYWIVGILAWKKTVIHFRFFDNYLEIYGKL